MKEQPKEETIEEATERSFSEDQVIELLEYVRTNYYDTGKHWHQEPDNDFTSKELFEQFKKKC